MSEEKDKQQEKFSRRSFLTKCGIAVVATASCELLSVFSSASAGQVPLCTQCNSFCVTSCTTNTCVNNNPPPPPPPTCVQGFGGKKD